jgi:hypothetical protein
MSVALTYTSAQKKSSGGFESLWPKNPVYYSQTTFIINTAKGTWRDQSLRMGANYNIKSDIYIYIGGWDI